jgi:hypothetical protein
MSEVAQSPTTENSRFLRACRGEAVDATPIWLMRQAGRYMPEYQRLREKHSLLELIKTPELACVVTLQPVNAFALDAAIIFADILPPLEGMGLDLAFAAGEGDDRELLWTVAPNHPIARGVPQPIVLPRHEMYGEYFDIPAPDELVFISSFSGGEVFRSGCCFKRGKGRVFYFSPGHETFPIYYQPEIGLVLANAVAWAHSDVHSPIATRRSQHASAGWFENT